MANSAKWFPNVDGTAKAWINWNGTAPAATHSFNVTSITDNGVGRNQPVYSASMTNATYAKQVTCVQRSFSNANDSMGISALDGAVTVSSCPCHCQKSDGAEVDQVDQSLIVMGDLA